MIVLNGSVRTVALQFSFSNPDVIPSAIKKFDRETPGERMKRKSYMSGLPVIEPTGMCSIEDFPEELESAGYELVDAFYKERIDGKDPRDARTYHMVRFLFARHEFVGLSDEFEKVRGTIRAGLQTICDDAIWRVRAFHNPFLKNGLEVPGQHAVSVNLEARHPIPKAVYNLKVLGGSILLKGGPMADQVVVLGFGSGPGASSGRDNEALARLVDSQNADTIFAQRSLTSALRGLGIEPDLEITGLVRESARHMADGLRSQDLLGENVRVVAGQGHMQAVLNELRRSGVKATPVGGSGTTTAETAAGGGDMWKWKLTGWSVLIAAVVAAMSWAFFGMLGVLF